MTNIIRDFNQQILDRMHQINLQIEDLELQLEVTLIRIEFWTQWSNGSFNNLLIRKSSLKRRIKALKAESKSLFSRMIHCC